VLLARLASIDVWTADTNIDPLVRLALHHVREKTIRGHIKELIVEVVRAMLPKQVLHVGGVGAKPDANCS
jgi:hypothetical protein